MQVYTVSHSDNCAACITSFTVSQSWHIKIKDTTGPPDDVEERDSRNDDCGNDNDDEDEDGDRMNDYLDSTNGLF